MMLQFVQTPDGKLLYRSLMAKGTEMVLDKSGRAPAEGIQERIWPGHAASFLIQEYLPRAKPSSGRIEPVDARPGLRRPDLRAAVLCRMTLTKKDRAGRPKVFTKERWLTEGASVNDSIRGEIDGEPFVEPIRLGFRNKEIGLGFELELMRAESLLDPGTRSPATYSSFVKLTDQRGGITGEDRWITMNEPLDHRGYKVYQSNFDTLGVEPETNKAIHLSGFTIGRDPGLWLKYLGTGLVGLGIAIMFWMKAYINHPRVGRLFRLFSSAR